MKVGAVFPQIELSGDPEALGTFGRAVEEMGYEHLTMYDHVVGAIHEGRDPPLTGPYTQNDPFHDPFVAFGYLAGITSRIRFVTGVLILPQRQTVLVAKQATDVDLLSGGRLCLGVGIGWNYVEYDALGQDFATRGARLSEQIPFLRRLWTESGIDWKGRFDSIDRGNIIPRPKRSIPIFCGGGSSAAYKRAAQLADGFIFAGGNVLNAIPDWKLLQKLLIEAGRPLEGFGAQCQIMNDQFRGLEAPATVDAIRRWEDAGGTHASIVSTGKGFTSARQHIDFLEEVRNCLG